MSKFPQSFGPYTLHTLIARGGMAEVYRATMPGIGGFEKTVAIKKILPHLAENEEFIQMLVDEARIIVDLNHANIAQVYDLGVIDGTYYIAMEYVHSVDLAAVLKLFENRGQALPIPHAVYIASCVCAGLHAAHSNHDEQGRPSNIVHRDISPHNVLLSYAGDVKIIDFGVAKARNKETHTKAGVIKGKLLYMAPEQAMNKEVDGRTDLFAAGLILYRMLTGKLPFEGGNEFQVYHNIMSKEITPPRVFNPEVTEELNQIVMMMLQRDVGKRYQEAYSAKLDLDRALHNIAPGYSVLRLSRFVEDHFSGDVSEGAATNHDQDSPQTPSFAGVSTDAGRVPASGPPQMPMRAQGGPPRAPGASFGGNHDVAETAEGDSLRGTPWSTDADISGARPANGFTTGNVGQIPAGFGTAEFKAHQYPDPAEAASASSSGAFAAEQTGSSRSSIPVAPLIGIAFLFLVLLVMIAYATFAKSSDEPAPKTVESAVVAPQDESTDESEEAEDVEPAAVEKEEPEQVVDGSVELSLKSSPTGATVRVDGEVFGETPAVLNITRSELALAIVIEAEGYEPESFEWVPEESMERDVELVALETETTESKGSEAETAGKSTREVESKPEPRPKPKPKPKPKSKPKAEPAEPDEEIGVPLLFGDDDDPDPEPSGGSKSDSSDDSDEEIINPFDL